MYWTLYIARYHPIRAARRTVLAVALLTVAVGAISSQRQHKRKPALPLAYTVTHTLVNRYPLGKGDDVDDIRWSPDGRKLAVAREDGQVILLPDRTTLWAGGKQSAGYPTRLWWSPDGSQIALLWNQVLEVLTLNTGEKQTIGDRIISAAWLPTPRLGSRSSIVGGLVCVKRADLEIDRNIVERVSASHRGSQTSIFRRTPVSTCFPLPPVGG